MKRDPDCNCGWIPEILPLKDHAGDCPALSHNKRIRALEAELAELKASKCPVCGEDKLTAEIGRKLGFRPDVMALKIQRLESELVSAQAELADARFRIRDLESELSAQEMIVATALVNLGVEAEGSSFEAEVGALEERIRELEATLVEADSFLVEWSHEAGWSTGHGDTLLDILREMKADQREEAAKTDADLIN